MGGTGRAYRGRGEAYTGFSQKSQETNIRAPNGIKTDNANKRGASDSQLRQHGHWDWRRTHLDIENFQQADVSNRLNKEKAALRL
jgi:hypothetical protein